MLNHNIDITQDKIQFIDSTRIIRLGQRLCLITYKAISFEGHKRTDQKPFVGMKPIDNFNWILLREVVLVLDIINNTIIITLISANY